MISESALEQLEFFKVTEYISKYASTQKGKERVSSSRPFNDKSGCEREGKYVTEARDILIEHDSPPIGYLPDLAADLARSKIENTALPKESILEILKLAQTGRELYKYLKSKNSGSVFSDIAVNLFIDNNFENSISAVFNDRGEVSDAASVTLRKIRRDIKEKSAQLTRVVNSILKKLSDSYLIQENFITLKEGRIVLPVKVEHKRHVKGFIHSESATGQTVYIEPAETLELNNELLSLHFEEKREIERILKQITKRIGDESENLKRSYFAVAYIDAIFAKAKYSIEIRGGFPQFIDNHKLNLIDGRHPILLKKIGKDGTVPLNISIDKNRVIIITGPNAGGKTVALKTLGLLSALAMSGFHIPANPDSNLLFFKDIQIDIGDKQSIEDDLSTFSWHLSNMKRILENSGEDTLVLLDEIGMGTDPAEGSAIAAAILIRLKESGAVALASTHHGNLKIVANELEGFENASMEFDPDNLIPTYKFIQGMPGSSYAFEVAERLGYSEDFINLAKQYTDSKKGKIEEFLADLEKKSFEYRESLRRMEVENSRLSGLTNLYRSKIKELEKQKKEILRETKKKAEDYLSGVNRKVEKAIKNIKEKSADKQTIKKEKKEIEKLKIEAQKIVAEDESELIPDKELSVGDFVKIKDTSTIGEILSIDQSRKIAIIKSGSIKLNAPIKSLSLAEKPEIKRSNEYRNTFRVSLESLRLDIRGQRPEEAESEVIRFLDSAFSSNNSRVEIIHGKGTGALKNTVREILKSTDYVKNYYFAKIESGGEGITVVELK